MGLSEKQEQIVQNIRAAEDGKFIIKACPGSGKTFTVAHLLIDEMKAWKSKTKGIAVLSFTNKASDEIEEKIGKQIGSKPRIGEPHFIGTFDNFFNSEIFSVFAKDALNLAREPELVGEPYSTWRYMNGMKWSGHLFEALNYDITGNFEDLNLYSVHMNRTAFNNDKEAIYSMKRTINALGYFTQRDATYYTYKILKENKDLVYLLSARYPYIVIDESQDSSDLSMAIVDLLVAAGTKKVVVIGDPDQAIYEWNNARPSLFWDKWHSDDWVKLDLDESFRSSNSICNFASSFARSTAFSAADSCEVKDYDKKPNLVGYEFSTDKNKLALSFAPIREVFLSMCQSSGIEINTKNVAILCRGREDVSVIKGEVDPGSYIDWSKCSLLSTPYICKAKFCFDIGDFTKAYSLWLTAKTLDSNKDMAYVHKPETLAFESTNGGKRMMMKQCMIELSSYTPIQQENLRSWVKTNIPTEISYATIDERSAVHALSYLGEDDPSNSPAYSTIHGVKGATFEAVLLFLKNQGGSTHYHTYVKDDNRNLMDDNTEEQRIVYVAITRPRKLLVVAAPNDHIDEWLKKFADTADLLV